MTGQGSTQHELIKKQRAGLHPIDISNVRTSNHSKVRGLRFTHTNNKTKDNVTVATAAVRKVIEGEVYMMNDVTNQMGWIATVWEIDGRHYDPDFDLIVKKQKVTQPLTLF
jgi:hypothetical protein